MKKTDYDRLLYVGSQLLKYENVVATGDTGSDDEDYLHFDIWIQTGDTLVPVEVKTLRFKYDDMKNTQRFTWRGLPDNVTSDMPVSILNAENNDSAHSKGKYYELVDNHAALVYLMKDCILWFSPDALKSANCGTAELLCSLTKERGKTDSIKTWQKKVVIDLSKAFKINVNPPKELFN